MIGFIRLFFKNTAGVAAAELALMLPLLTLLFYGTMEMSNLLWAEHQVVKSVRNGARFAARQAPTNFSCGATGVGAADAAVRNMVRTGTADGTGSPVVRGWTDGSATTIAISVVCDTTSTFANGGIYNDASGTGSPVLSSAMRVNIDATVPVPTLFGTWWFSGKTLNAESESPVTGF